MTVSRLRLSVVIPATNQPPTLTACLAAIAASDEPADEVMVIDDLAGASPGRARNVGVARSVGEVIVFVDADVEIHHDALSRIRRVFERRPDVAAVFGSYDDAPAAPGVVSRFRNLLHHHVHHEAAGPARTFWAGIGAVRRIAFDHVDGFDERIDRPSIEDIELGMRLTSAGYSILLDPSIQGTHLKRWPLLEMVRTDFRDRGVPWVELLVRSRSLPSTLNLGWRHRLSAAAALSIAFSTLLRSRRPGLVGTVTIVALNWRFYGLLFRVGGAKLAAAGLPLHLLHHLTGAVAVPAGIIRYLRRS